MGGLFVLLTALSVLLAAYARYYFLGVVLLAMIAGAAMVACGAARKRTKLLGLGALVAIASLVLLIVGGSRALWIGLSRGGDELKSLREQVAARLSSAGVAIDRRPFAPHLTVGRFREGSSSDRMRLHGQRSRKPVLASLDVREVVLFESRLSSAGADHSVRLRTPLAGPALH